MSGITDDEIVSADLGGPHSPAAAQREQTRVLPSLLPIWHMVADSAAEAVQVFEVLRLAMGQPINMVREWVEGLPG